MHATVRLHEWMSAAQQRVQHARTSSRSVDTAFVVQVHDRNVGGNLLASAIAYRLFLWMLPVALLLAAGLGFAQASGTDTPAEIGQDLGFARSIVSAVADAAQQAEKSRYLLLAIALFGVYSAGGAGAKTVIAVHRFCWGLSPIGPRVGPLASLAFTGTVFAAMAVSALTQVIRREWPGLGIPGLILVFLLDTAFWLGVSMLLPHAGAPWIRLVPGAVLVGVGMQVMHLASVFYLSNKIESASELYGGLGFAATILLGLYLVARLMVASAVLNATLADDVDASALGSPRKGEADEQTAAG